ncbi:thiamine phosphate synthase [Afifella sp. H1R]|uniref:thiamine phosphate synthase n=1 Tax=Afifella sp. H1R TaxID=2908841 RepID=UPI001F264909|nr:thiamine phosphate synthase [Afifella sp. H1R]MCF1504172.1 thiamine phosphate synthase [Afifella sp. H1R]
MTQKTDADQMTPRPAEDEALPPQIFLIAPSSGDETKDVEALETALAAAPVAAVLITASPSETETEARARRLVPVIQAAGAAALLENFTRAAGHVGADGVHIANGHQNLVIAAESFRPQRIVGAGKLKTRDIAMLAGELDIDYLFFGEPDGDSHDEPHPKALALAEWWASMMEVPAVIMAGASLETLPQAVATGAEFVALRRAVWEAPDGPAEAMRRVSDIILQRPVAA